MPAAHRNGDSRVCGAVTVVAGQDFVYVDSELWAVEGDPNSHGDGQLIPTYHGVYINDIPVIVHTPDQASPDDLCPPDGPPHCDPETAEGSPGVFSYG